MDDFGELAVRKRLTASDVHNVWQAAALFDDSVAARPNIIAALARKRVRPIPFSRSQLFAYMLACEPVLFLDFPIKPRIGGRKHRKFSIADEIRLGLPRSVRALVRRSGSPTYLPVPQVVDRWERGKSVFGVTDLHYIGSPFDARIDTSGLNDFNLLPRGTDGFQSQDSLVISSAGAVTDSHSDDHSGSNHSFIGTKLWLLWDTVEGFQFGLEDAERCEVYERAAFDVGAFAAMRTSRWVLIGAGQTMFIPAHLTHKVITLQRYLGLGSFHAGLPGFVDLLKRWAQLSPLWASRSRVPNRCSVDFITRRAVRKIESLRLAPRPERIRWGVPYLQRRLQQPDIHAKVLDINGAPADSSNLNSFVRAARLL
jgi:hypothetical protein